MLGRCEYPHDALAFAVSGVVCVGLVVSYLPQVVRILATGSSIGLSPWFLFLGATSSASTFLNVLTLQWGVVRCCPSMPSLACMEHTMGILQTFLQWFMFTVIALLFLAYYPKQHVAPRKHRARSHRHRHRGGHSSEHRHGEPDGGGHASSGSESDLESINTHIYQSYGAVSQVDPVGIRDERTHAEREPTSLTNVPDPMRRIMEQHRSTLDPDLLNQVGSAIEWRTARILAWVALAHLVVCLVGTAVAVSTRKHGHGRRHSSWASFLGLAGTVLAAAQYLPQIVHTARTRLVQSLSIPMMMLQVPGCLLFVYSLAVRPGTDWTSLLAYVVTGVMQLCLLVLCCAWKVRQARAHVDDYGRPLPLLAQD